MPDDTESVQMDLFEAPEQQPEPSPPEAKVIEPYVATPPPRKVKTVICIGNCDICRYCANSSNRD